MRYGDVAAVVVVMGEVSGTHCHAAYASSEDPDRLTRAVPGDASQESIVEGECA